MKAQELIQRLTEAVDEYGADMWITIRPMYEQDAGDDLTGVYVHDDEIHLTHP